MFYFVRFILTYSSNFNVKKNANWFLFFIIETISKIKKLARIMLPQTVTKIVKQKNKTIKKEFKNSKLLHLKNHLLEYCKSDHDVLEEFKDTYCFVLQIIFQRA
jgi:hypothetical protein